MKHLFASLMCVLLMAGGCGDKPAPEPEEVRDASGKLMEGISRNYFENGKLRNEVPVKDGLRDGVAREYYESGQLAAEISYQADVKHGSSKWYYQDGILYQEAAFKSNEKDGLEKKYYNTGELMAVLKWKAGKPMPGLVEYQLNGKEIKQPSIVVSKKGRNFEIRMSNGATNVRYFRGKLADGEPFDENNFEAIPTEAGKSTVPVDDTLLELIAVRRSNMKNPQILLYSEQP